MKGQVAGVAGGLEGFADRQHRFLSKAGQAHAGAVTVEPLFTRWPTSLGAISLAIVASRLGRQTDCAVEADHFAVEHHVVDDGAHQRRELGRAAEAVGKGVALPGNPASCGSASIIGVRNSPARWW